MKAMWNAAGIPTTGVVVGEALYYIANSQVDQVDEATGVPRDPEKLEAPVVLRLPLAGAR